MVMRKPRRPMRLLACVVAAPVIAFAALAAFAWPSARLEPRSLPIAVVGSTQTIAPLLVRLEERAGAFDVHVYPDGAAAKRAIEDRQVYGAFVATPTGMTVLTSSAASPLVAQQIVAVAPQLVAHPSADPPVRPAAARPVNIVDVVPADAHDPRGAALSSTVLPLVLTGVLTGLIIATLTVRGLMQMGALIAASAAAGLAAATVVQSWLDVLSGHWIANAAVLGLTVMAISTTVVGLGWLLGRAGQVLGALLMVFVGNPFSGVSAAPELLPQPVGWIGRFLPPGAAAELLRSSAFFGGNGAAEPAIVLSVWAGCGLLLIAEKTLRPRWRSQPVHVAKHVPSIQSVRP
ncbi:hypothetical protein FB559_6404 [Actinoallomurus bryophytorum]|uniref:ABC transporter permease n=2 Tax=Actinoallomurus bryophytorum TaxID=1490222 RepID=A0A543CUD1_9ACTN|nr:hypothetical protein FB559_6404 [Actinoallomurus bryophytorum]